VGGRFTSDWGPLVTGGGGRPAVTLGRWLREQRQERGWSRSEMARQLRQSAKASDDELPCMESMCHNIYRWERGETGVSERYILHYCRAFGIEVDQFGPPSERRSDPKRLADIMRDVSDGLRADAKLYTERVGELATDPIRAALYRGEALGLRRAAEHIDAGVATSADLAAAPS
jgi:transcriptional regulator with XRE-family HTH domain